MLLQIAQRLKNSFSSLPVVDEEMPEPPVIDFGNSTVHGEIFEGACKDTRTAWAKTSISKMMKSDQLERLRGVMKDGGAEEISDILVHMMQNPYSSLALAKGFNDSNIVTMAKLMIRAFSEPFVKSRKAGALVDLCGMRDSLKKWVISGELPMGQPRSSDIGKITDLVVHPEQRSVLAAGFAPAIQFAALALSLEGVAP